MASTLHNHWTKTKDNLTKSAADIKKTRGNSKPVEDALKKFNKGFGPLLDKVADAYKAKNDADIKKHAAAALNISKEYKKVIDGIPYECRIDAGQRLNVITKALTELNKDGSKAGDYFKKF